MWAKASGFVVTYLWVVVTSDAVQLGKAEPRPVAGRALQSKVPRGTPPPFCRRQTYGLTAGATFQRSDKHRMVGVPRTLCQAENVPLCRVRSCFAASLQRQQYSSAPPSRARPSPREGAFASSQGQAQLSVFRSNVRAWRQAWVRRNCGLQVCARQLAQIVAQVFEGQITRAGTEKIARPNG